MTAPVLVDVEALVTTFLRANAEVVAVVSDRVYTDLPHKPTYPLILATRTGGGFTTSRPLWLDAAEVTVAAYGGTHKVAQSLMSTVLGALTADSFRTNHALGCVTKVSVGEIGYTPEPDSFDEAGHSRPRFTAVVTVVTHP